MRPAGGLPTASMLDRKLAALGMKDRSQSVKLDLRDRRLRDTALLIGIAISTLNVGIGLGKVDVGAATGLIVANAIFGAVVSVGLLVLVLRGIWKSDPGEAPATTP